MALGMSVDSYVEEVTPVVNKEKRKMRRLTMVAGVGAAVLGAIALSAVTFTDSSNTRAFLPQARLLQANGTDDAAAAAAAAAGAAPVITFPDDYPNSVRHFLLIGFLVWVCSTRQPT